jgi:hypothetical protein
MGVLAPSQIRAFKDTAGHPACAGMTFRTPPLEGSLTDPPPPRGVCGDDHEASTLAIGKTGPPPRVRGRLPLPQPQRDVVRTTPARTGSTVAAAGPCSALADHPRVCGDDACVLSRSVVAVGPPPRARGRHLVDRGGVQAIRTTPACAGTTRTRCTRSGTVRTTPACAGTTPPASTPTRCRSDHPRGCGDDPWYVDNNIPLPGLPPRVRGQPAGHGIGDKTDRTTPAGAGTTPTPRSSSTRTPDHPRVCGDDGTGLVIIVLQVGPPRVCGDDGVQNTDGAEILGPPPRVRGRRADHRRDLAGDRTTPACGDDCSTKPPSLRDSGPPPRVRGRRARQQVRTPRVRTTPARAGTTRSRCGPPRRSSDHPRVCGDDSAGPCRLGAGHQTTPACAGTTASGTGLPAGVPDHPRAGGDDSIRTTRPTPAFGSPPRVRGRPRGDAGLVVDRRTTPACAGGRRGHGHRADPAPGTTPAGAGTTCPGCTRGARRADHPRGRGDHEARLILGLCDRGPPRMLGTTAARWRGTSPSTDYPRISRDGWSSVIGTSWPHGSPPRGRGPQHPNRLRGRQRRTPLRAQG